MEKRLKKQHIIKAIFAFGVQAVGIGVNFLFNVLLARLLRSSDTGIYFLAVTVLTICATTARLGLDNAVLRFASVAHDQGRSAVLSALYKRSVGLVIVSGACMMLLLGLVIPYLPLGRGHEKALQDVLAIMLPAMVPFALLLLHGEFFKAIGKPTLAVLMQSVILPAFLVSGILYYMVEGKATIQNIACLYAVSVSAAFVMAIVVLSSLKPSLWGGSGYFDVRILLRASMPLMWVALLNMLMSWTDILVLGMWATPSTLGIYGVAGRIASLTAIILAVVNTIVAPRFAALHSANQQGELQNLAQKSAGLTFLVSSPIMLAMIFFPEPLLQLFGSEFVQGAQILRILAVGQVINVSMGSVGYLLMMTGHEKIMRNNSMVSALLNLLGNLVLVPRYGANGAALSTAFALGFMNIISFVMVNKKLRINTLAYLFRSPA